MNARKPLNLEDFEFHLWRLLHNQPISTTIQNRLGNSILLLANEHIRSRPPQSAQLGQLPLDGPVHYFRGPEPFDLSHCGKVSIERLPVSRVTSDRSRVSCGNCLRKADDE